MLFRGLLLAILLSPNVTCTHGRSLEHTANPEAVIVQDLIRLQFPVALVKGHARIVHVPDACLVEEGHEARRLATQNVHSSLL